MLNIRGRRRPQRSAAAPKISAPSGRNISAIVIAKAVTGIDSLKSSAIFETTKVTKKKSNASRVQPRKAAKNAVRW
jgi:hypothetical protein